MLVLDKLDLQLDLLQKIKMNENNLLMIVAIVAVGVALINLGITINKIGDIREITGYATGIGEANVTIISAASVAFITSSVNWGYGRVNETPIYAYMDTEGNVVDGNWTPVTQGLTLQNDGNCNVTFNISTDTAATFIGGTGPWYQIKLSNNESNSCGGVNSLSTYTNTTGTVQQACDNFSYATNSRAVDIDINITIPEDAVAEAKGTLLTVIANCI